MRGSSGFKFLRSLRWRFSLVLSGFVLFCTAACVIGSVIFLDRALTSRSSTDLQQTLHGASGYLDNQSSDLLGIAELVASDPVVRAKTRNHHALILHLTRLYADLDADILDVVGSNGHVVLRMEDTVTFGDAATSVLGVRRALSGIEGVALERDATDRPAAGGYALRATVPIRDGTRIVGAVVAGRRLDSVFAARIGRASDADVNLIAANHRTGTTLTDPNGLPATGIAEPASVLQRIGRGIQSVEITQEDGRSFNSGIVPLKAADGKVVGAVEVLRPLDSLYDVIRGLSVLLLVLGVLVVIVGTIFALIVGRSLTSRLKTLQSTASQVATRASSQQPLADLVGTVRVTGNDEVASLSRSFTAMMSALDERLATNAHLYEAAQSRVNELTGLAEIARLLTAAQPIQETVNALGALVCKLVGCSGVAIYVSGNDRLPAIHGGYGLPDTYATSMRQAIEVRSGDESPVASQAAFWTGRPTWRSLDATGEANRDLFRIARDRGWGAVTAIPLRLQERTTGVLTCYTTGDTPLPASDLSLLSTIAGQVAIAVENARLYTQAHELAAIEERSRLARELHDSVTQALFSMTMQARAAQIMLERDGVPADGRIARSLKELSELTQGALAEMRALIFELRPDALREEGLIAALRKQGAALSARESLDVHVDASGDRLPLDPAVEEQVYRVAQEALHNVVKHARASAVTIRMTVDADRPATLILEIEDDGVGFDTATEHPGHLGLGTMADRMTQIGGALEVASAPGNGCVVRIVVPHAIDQRQDIAVS